MVVLLVEEGRRKGWLVGWRRGGPADQNVSGVSGCLRPQRSGLRAQRGRLMNEGLDVVVVVDRQKAMLRLAGWQAG